MHCKYVLNQRLSVKQIWTCTASKEINVFLKYMLQLTAKRFHVETLFCYGVIIISHMIEYVLCFMYKHIYELNKSNRNYHQARWNVKNNEAKFKPDLLKRPLYLTLQCYEGIIDQLQSREIYWCNYAPMPFSGCWGKPLLKWRQGSLCTPHRKQRMRYLILAPISLNLR